MDTARYSGQSLSKPKRNFRLFLLDQVCHSTMRLARAGERPCGAWPGIAGPGIAGPGVVGAAIAGWLWLFSRLKRRRVEARHVALAVGRLTQVSPRVPSYWRQRPAAGRYAPAPLPVAERPTDSQIGPRVLQQALAAAEPLVLAVRAVRPLAQRTPRSTQL